MSVLKVGQLIELIDKNISGKVAYIGLTKFANGKWVGIVLDEAKGKNNGTIDGVTYFNCPANFGIFVKFNSPTIKILSIDKNDERTGSNSSLASSTSTTSSRLKRPSTFGSKSSISSKLTSSITEKSESYLPKLSSSKKEDDLQQLQSQIEQLTSQPITTTNFKPINRPSSIDVKAMVNNKI